MHVQGRRTEQRPDAQQEDDLGDVQQRRQQPGEEAGHQQQAERQDDVARHGSRLACCSSARRAMSDAVSSSRTISTPGAEADDHEALLGVGQALIEGPLDLVVAALLLGGELARGGGHRLEVADLGAEEDLLDAARPGRPAARGRRRRRGP